MIQNLTCNKNFDSETVFFSQILLFWERLRLHKMAFVWCKQIKNVIFWKQSYHQKLLLWKIILFRILTRSQSFATKYVELQKVGSYLTRSEFLIQDQTRFTKSDSKSEFSMKNCFKKSFSPENHFLRIMFF